MNSLLYQSPWILSGAALFVIALVRFNAPPTNRSGTTFFLFYFGVLFYFAMLIAIWFLVIVLIKTGGAGLSNVSKAIDKPIDIPAQLDFVVPVIAALFVAVTSQIRRVKLLDNGARSFCLAAASIPREAEKLGFELSGTDFHIPDDKLRAEISHEVRSNIGANALKFENDGSFAGQVCRAISLYWIFCRPAAHVNLPIINRSGYARVLRDSTDILQKASARYRSLLEIALAHFTSAKPTPEMDEALRRAAHELSLLCSIVIARYVLVQGHTAAQRSRLLSDLGFNLQDQPPDFGFDQWVASIIIVVSLFILTSVMWPPAEDPRTGTLNYISLSVLAALKIGIAVLAGTSVAHRFLKKHPTAKAFPPFAELTVAALIVCGLCIALQIIWILAPGLLTARALNLQFVVQDFGRKWAWNILPFLGTFSIGLICAYLASAPFKRVYLVSLGAILNGLAFALAGSLIVGFLPADILARMTQKSMEARYLVPAVLFVTGMLLGAFVVSTFRKKYKADQTLGHATDRNLHRNSPSILSSGGGPLELTNGLYSRQKVSALEGRFLCLRPVFSDPTIVNAYIISIEWSVTDQCLMFREEYRHDSLHTQKGKVLIPEGKPFINLVTMDNGAVRLMIFTRPETNELARGIILTLANPAGVHFVPACARVVLSKIEQDAPSVGFIHPGDPAYRPYCQMLESVTSDYALFTEGHVAPSLSAASKPGKGSRRRKQNGGNGGAALQSEAESVSAVGSQN